LDESGLPWAIADLPLFPGQQSAQNLQELFENTNILGMPGWVSASSDNIQVVGFFLTFRDEIPVTQIDGAAGLLTGQLASSLVFPEILNGPGEFTEVTVIGFHPQEDRVEFRLMSENGTVLESVQRQLPPFIDLGSQLTERVEDLFSVAIPDKSYLLVTGNGIGLVGFEEFGNDQSTAGRNAIAADSQAIDIPSSLFGAQFAEVAGLTSVLTLINPTDSQAQVVLTATPKDPEGQAVSVGLTLGRGEMLRDSASSIFGFQDEFEGWVEAASDITGLVGDVTFGGTDGSFLSSVQLQDIPVAEAIFSQVAQSPISFTGVTFLNPNQDPVQVEIEVFDAQALMTGSTVITLAAGEHRPGLLPEHITGFADQSGGYIRISAQQPIFTFELFGFIDPANGALTALSAVPPQRMSGILSGSVLLPEGVSAQEAGTVFVVAVDPATQKTQRSGIADQALALDYRLTAFTGLYQMVAGTDPDGNGFICDDAAGELCGFFTDGPEIATVALEAGQETAAINIQLQSAAPLSLLRSLPGKGKGIRVLAGGQKKR
ncbi:MAG: hypothetical protein V3T83_11795, partial [Acidobacteriota bacterium]